MTNTERTAPPEKQKGVLSLTIKDKGALYAAYMSFIKGGGLFIPTNKSYKLGDEVFMLLKLMDETEKTPVVGIVVWKTPKAAQGSRITGIGVQFSQDSEGAAIRDKIETYLAGTQNADRLTHTM